MEGGIGREALAQIRAPLLLSALRHTQEIRREGGVFDVLRSLNCELCLEKQTWLSSNVGLNEDMPLRSLEERGGEPFRFAMKVTERSPAMGITSRYRGCMKLGTGGSRGDVAAGRAFRRST